ncbi:MAG: hypothetical protein PHX79_06370, partial [Sphaerochaetaceae bacterium]|nr:hypothetical protein [Sphaerochaetaceae bacterium]
GKDRPVLLNRAPTIAEGSITAHHPIFVDKLNINIPNSLALFQKADFDGDSVCATITYVNNLSIFRRAFFILTEIGRLLQIISMKRSRKND